MAPDDLPTAPPRAARRTARLALEPMTMAHAGDLLAMHADAVTMATLGGVRDAAETAAYLARSVGHWEAHGWGIWVARDAESGRFVGRGGICWTEVAGEAAVEVAYALRAEWWGRGLATELAQHAVAFAFRDVGLPELVCFTLVTNAASQRVMRKAGFTPGREIAHRGMPHILMRQRADDWMRTRDLASR